MFCLKGVFNSVSSVRRGLVCLLILAANVARTPQSIMGRKHLIFLFISFKLVDHKLTGRIEKANSVDKFLRSQK